MAEKTVVVPQISCAHCLHAIREEIGGLPGVLSVSGQVERKTVTIKWQPPATWEKITAALAAIGYPAGS